jgi:hypothetical protein
LRVSVEELEKLFVEQAEKLRTAGNAQFSNLSEHVSNRVFGDLQDTRYQNVQELLKRVDEEAERIARRRDLEALVARLAVDTDVVLKELVEGAKGLARHPLFAEVDPNTMADQICKMQSSGIIAVRNFVESRYGAHGIGRIFGAERHNLAQLAKLLSEFKSGQAAKLSSHAIGVLVESLEKACKRIDEEANS